MRTAKPITQILFQTFLTAFVFSILSACGSFQVQIENDVAGADIPAECSFGPMGAECKKDPPEERPLECLCFLDAEDPFSVLMQSLFSMQGEEFTMLTFTVSQYDTPAFNPPESEEWIPWFKDNWSYLSEDIPDESNMTLGGWPAVRIYSPGSPQANAAENIFVLKNGKLIQIMMIDVDVPELRERYETILSTFEFYD